MYKFYLVTTGLRRMLVDNDTGDLLCADTFDEAVEMASQDGVQALDDEFEGFTVLELSDEEARVRTKLRVKFTKKNSPTKIEIEKKEEGPLT